MAQPAEAAPAETAAPAKSKKKLFILLGAAGVLLGGGAGAWFLLQDSHAASAAKVEAPQPPIFMPLEPFVVNLQGGEKFLQTDITLQLAEEAQVEMIKLHMPRVRSRLLTLLSGMEAEHLVSKEDKIKLAQAILTQIQLPFDSRGKPQQVKDVLFTSFVIQ
jgi:flagellar FliL protein